MFKESIMAMALILSVMTVAGLLTHYLDGIY